MMPCQDVRNLIEEHLAGTLDGKRRRALIAHLKTCPDCHRAVEEARLAGMVLREASQLPPPPDLAVRIKSAARFRLLNRPRPLHERALGSPAFLATCASLLCGAIICLSAILRVASVPVDPPGRQLAAQPVEVHSMVTVQRPVPAGVRVASQRPPLLRDVVHVERPRQSGVAILPAAPMKTRTALPGRTSPVAGAMARLAGAERPFSVRTADHRRIDLPARSP
jgi:anti-sigma factor RsiW